MHLIINNNETVTEPAEHREVYTHKLTAHIRKRENVKKKKTTHEKAWPRRSYTENRRNQEDFMMCRNVSEFMF